MGLYVGRGPEGHGFHVGRSYGVNGYAGRINSGGNLLHTLLLVSVVAIGVYIVAKKL